MKRSLLYLIPALLITLVFSCKKDDSGEHNTVTPGRYRSLDEALASTAPVSKSTSIIVSTGASLVASNGTVFNIPPNAFQTQSGGKVTGSVLVTFQDWLKKGDMVFGKVLPLNYGSVLESGGEAFISVTQNGEVLTLKPGMHVNVLFPQFGITGLTFSGWVGRTMQGSSNTVNWLPADPARITPAYAIDTVYTSTDTLHYIQAALPLVFADTRNFTVKLNSPVTLEQSMAVALYDNHKAIYPLPSAINGFVNAQNVPNLPIVVAVMGINAGEFYAGYVAVPTPGNDSTYEVKIQAYQPPTFKLLLNSFL